MDCRGTNPADTRLAFALWIGLLPNRNGRSFGSPSSWCWLLGGGEPRAIGEGSLKRMPRFCERKKIGIGCGSYKTKRGHGGRASPKKGLMLPCGFSYKPKT